MRRFASVRSAWRVVEPRAQRAGAAVLRGCGGLAILALGLMCLARVDVSTASPDLDPGDGPNGIAVASVLTDVWVARPLLDRIRDRPATDTSPDVDRVRDDLRAHGLGAAWFAIRARHHDAAGRVAALTYVGRVDGGSSTALANLVLAVDLSSARASSRFAHHGPAPTFHLIPESLRRAEPLRALAELTEETAPTAEVERRPAGAAPVDD